MGHLNFRLLRTHPFFASFSSPFSPSSSLLCLAGIALVLAACTSTDSGSSGGAFATGETGLTFTANGTAHNYTPPDDLLQLQLGNSITRDIAVYWRGANVDQGFLFLIPSATGTHACGDPRGTNGNLFASMQIQFSGSATYRAGYLNGVSSAGWNSPQDGKSNCTISVTTASGAWHPETTVTIIPVYNDTVTTIGEVYRGVLAGTFSGKLYTGAGDSLIVTGGEFRIEQ